MAVYERRHAGITESAFSVSSEQSACVSAIFADLKTTDGDKFDDVLEHVIFRFARKHAFNVKQAADAFRAYVKWRADNNVDNVLASNYAKYDVIKKCVPFSYAGYDKIGRPVYIEKTGRLAIQAVTDSRIVTVDEFLGSHIWGMEHMAHLAFKKSLELGKRVDTISSILDMNGLSLSHRQAIHVLKAAMDLDSKYYPERMGKIYVINTPFFAPTMYQLVQVFLDDYTKSTIELLYDHRSVLPTVIDASILPAEYGGSAPNIDVSETESLVQAADSADDGCEKQYVSYDFEKVLTSDNKSSFAWYFRSAGDYDIDFSVTAITPQGKVNVVPVSRVVTSKGSWTSSGPAKLVIRWDNNFSYLYGKNITYFALVSPLDELVALRDSQESVSSQQEKEQKEKQQAK